MSATPTASAQSPDVVEHALETSEPSGASQTLITPQEVVFSTAAATMPATAPRWIDALRRLLAAFTDQHARGRPVQPRRRASYIEAACMAREMDRL